MACQSVSLAISLVAVAPTVQESMEQKQSRVAAACCWACHSCGKEHRCFRAHALHTIAVGAKSDAGVFCVTARTGLVWGLAQFVRKLASTLS
jgi:hypothetical protein